MLVLCILAVCAVGGRPEVEEEEDNWGWEPKGIYFYKSISNWLNSFLKNNNSELYVQYGNNID